MSNTPEAQARSRQRFQHSRRWWWTAMVAWFAGFAVTFAVREQWLDHRAAPFIFGLCFLGWVFSNRAWETNAAAHAKFALNGDA